MYLTVNRCAVSLKGKDEPDLSPAIIIDLHQPDHAAAGRFLAHFLLFLHSVFIQFISLCSSWVLIISGLRLSFSNWLHVLNCLDFCGVGGNWRLTISKGILGVCLYKENKKTKKKHDMASTDCWAIQCVGQSYLM